MRLRHILRSRRKISITSARHRMESLEVRRLLTAAISFDGGHNYDTANFSPAETATGFFNAGTLPDIAALTQINSTTNVDIILGNGDGTFRAGSTTNVGFAGADLALGDFNGDGKTDVILSHNKSTNPGTTGFINFLPGNGDGTLQAPIATTFAEGASLSSFTVADLNGDGKADLVTVNPLGMTIRLGNGDGTFNTFLNDSNLTSVGDLQAIDVNGDGRLDLLFGYGDSNGVNYVGVKLRNADGTFQGTRSSITAGFVETVALGDFNSDGKKDFVITEGVPAGGPDNGIVELKLGDGQGTVTSTKTYHIASTLGRVVVGDFDLDFQLDAAISFRNILTPQTTSFYIMRGNGDGSLQTQIGGAPTSDNTGNLFTADYNGDGKPDLLSNIASSSSISTFLNTAIPQNLIRGHVWNDDNQNQKFDFLESELAGRTVYIDGDNDGFLNAGELSTTTAADGSYQFVVPDGNFKVREILPPAWIQTTPPNFGTSIPPALTVSVSGHSINAGNDFGTYFQGNISGRVYNDFNANHKLDQFENGLAGRTVFIDANNNGVLDAGETTVLTDSQGVYRFILPAGTYRVRQYLPAGWYQTTPSVPYTIAASDAQPAGGIDFGATQLGTISGRVYYDRAADSISDDSDPGLSGFKVYIDANYDGAFDAGDSSAITDPQGRYSFPNLFPGAYSIRVVKPAGWVQISPAHAAGATDAPFNTLANGGFESFYTDFGLIHPSYIQGRVFNDADGNGTQNGSEAGLPNFEVFADLSSAGISVFHNPYTVTDAQGNYSLRIPIDGTFAVHVIRPSGYLSTAPADNTYSLNFTNGAVFSGKNFGLKQGAFNNAGFANPVNLDASQFNFVNPISVAADDFNHDGKMDFAVANNNADITAFIGNGLGVFTSSSAGFGGAAKRAIISADVNNDTFPDLLTANQDDSSVSVLLGNGNGTFKTNVDYPAASGAYCLVAADFNGDNKLDLAVGGASDPHVVLLINNGSGGFNAPVNIGDSAGTYGIAAGDFNKDGKRDLVWTNQNSDGVTILLGNGNGTFQSPKFITTGITQPGSVAIGDFNKDTFPDIAVLNTFTDVVRVFKGKGDGTFDSGTNYGIGSTPSQVIAVDIDKDGSLDLAIAYKSDGTTDISGGVNVLRNHGDGTFESALTVTAHTSPDSVATADFNGDGLPDLVATNFYSDDVSVMINNRTPSATISGNVFDDVNGDGVKGAGEGPLASHAVYLDLNGNGSYEAGEPTATTDVSGNFALPPVTAGQYQVRFLPDGNYAQTLPAGGAGIAVNASPGGATTGLVLGAHDSVPPGILNSQFTFDAPAMFATIAFTENVGTTLSSADIHLLNRTTNQTIAPANFVLSYNATTFAATLTFPGYPHGALPNGDYRLTIPAGAVADSSGNALGADFTFDFFVLAGDVNHDRTVGFTDLVAVAQHYGATAGVSFSKGDLNYDGKVDFADLVIVAQKYGTSLAAPIGAPVAAAGAMAALLPDKTVSATPSINRSLLKTMFSVTPVAKLIAPRPRPLIRPDHR